MNTEILLELGSRGVHLLFDNKTIGDALRQDADYLRQELESHEDEVYSAIYSVAVESCTIEDARNLVDSLPSFARHILVLAYFQLLDDKMRRSATLH